MMKLEKYPKNIRNIHSWILMRYVFKSKFIYLNNIDNFFHGKLRFCEDIYVRYVYVLI